MRTVRDIAAGIEGVIWHELGAYQGAHDQAMIESREVTAVRRIWARDGSLWAEQASTIAAIENRLGWLDSPEAMRVDTLRLKALASEVNAAGIEHVVLLGMGGSSLAAEVIGELLGDTQGLAPRLMVLDSTDPAQIRRTAEMCPILTTLFVVSSKSGTTAETRNLQAYFADLVQTQLGEEEWGNHFVAVTDPGTDLEQVALMHRFRSTYANPPDIGGRYSALSLYGLVPACLVGVDVDQLLARGLSMAKQCRLRAIDQPNPGLILGSAMGGLAGAGRDKLTLLASPEVASLAAWIEQLVAESTGKDGIGILPVEDEALITAGHYSSDRLFVYLRLDDGDNVERDARFTELLALGHPVVLLRLRDRFDLGGQFFLWEFATAVAGRILGINPFDQPDVETAKVGAREALEEFERSQSFPESLGDNGDEQFDIGEASELDTSLVDRLRAFLEDCRPGTFVALMAYIDRSPRYVATLHEIRALIAAERGVATTVGFGPRFLHSTGQFHKGGTNQGLFLQITQEEECDLPIPGHAYTFGTLKRAQAMGDAEALHDAGRRVLTLHMEGTGDAGLRQIARGFREAL